MFGVGSVLATTVRTWLRNVPRFALVATVLNLPFIAWGVALAFEPSRDLLNERYYTPLFELHPVVSTLASGRWIFDALTTAAITVYVVARMRGESASMVTGLGAALKRPRVLGGGFVEHLGSSGILVVSALLIWDGWEWIGRTPYSYYGWIVLWVALASLWVVVVPVIVIERRGVFSAIRRNFALGHRVKVFALVAVQHAFFVGLHYALYYAIVPTSYDFDTYRQRVEIYDYVSLGLGLVLVTFSATFAAVTYEKLRAAKDGPSEGELHRVFE